MNNKRYNFLVSLGEDESTEIAVVGGKGASLGKLVKAGFPVPSGFVVTTSGYIEFLRANDIEKNIGKFLASIYHPDRFRMQLPPQRCSFNLKIAKEIDEIIKKETPDRNMRIAMSYAKGNQVVVEAIISWTEKGVLKETPFLSFLLLDKNGLIIRDRRHIIMQNWPAAKNIKERLGI